MSTLAGLLNQPYIDDKFLENSFKGIIIAPTFSQASGDIIYSTTVGLNKDPNISETQLLEFINSIAKSAIYLSDFFTSNFAYYELFEPHNAYLFSMMIFKDDTVKVINEELTLIRSQNFKDSLDMINALEFKKMIDQYIYKSLSIHLQKLCNNSKKINIQERSEAFQLLSEKNVTSLVKAFEVVSKNKNIIEKSFSNLNDSFILDPNVSLYLKSVENFINICYVESRHLY